MPPSRSLISLAFLSLLLLAGCAQPPTFAQVAPTIQPPAPGTARIYFYRDYEPYESLTWTPVSLNGKDVGASAPGVVFYRDVPPGSYYITVLSQGLYPNQFKTIQVAAGQTWYIKIESLHTWIGEDDLDFMGGDTFVVAIMDPAVGRQQIQSMWYTNNS